MGLEEIGHSLLLKLPSETAHEIGKWAMKRRICAPGKFHTFESETELFGVKLDNPFGLAAGFDKYAELQDVVSDYGFGWIEEGSFTYLGGSGNKKPRLFRIFDSGSLLNRMGLNCISAFEASVRLRKAENKFSFAVSVAKSNRDEIVGDAAIEDIVMSYNELKNLGIYTAINVSCVNTKDGKTFEEPGSFRELVSALKSAGKGRPLVYKFSPKLEREKLENLVEISYESADGYELVNTLSFEHEPYGKGGLSGPEIRARALTSVGMLRELTNKTILGVGGISTGRDSYFMKQAGAGAFLVFTGFVFRHRQNPYAGPRFAHKINKEHLELINNDVWEGIVKDINFY